MRSGFLLSLLLIASLSTPAGAVDVARMEQVIQADAADNSFMGAVLVAQGDTILVDKGYGSANLMISRGTWLYIGAVRASAFDIRGVGVRSRGRIYGCVGRELFALSGTTSKTEWHVTGRKLAAVIVAGRTT